MTYPAIDYMNNILAVFRHTKGPRKTMDTSIPVTAPLSADTLPPDLLQSLNQLFTRQSAFMAFITAEKQISDEDIWQAIQDHGGMRGMSRDAFSLLVFLRRVGVPKEDPEEFELASSRARVLYLSWYLVIIDKVLQRIEPRIGRPIARIAAREYYDLCIQGSILGEEYCPEIASNLAP